MNQSILEIPKNWVYQDDEQKNPLPVYLCRYGRLWHPLTYTEKVKKRGNHNDTHTDWTNIVASGAGEREGNS